MQQRNVPRPVVEDDDEIVLALETARVSEERRDIESAVRWLKRAISAARHQGRAERAGVLSRSLLQIQGTNAEFEERRAEAHRLDEIKEDDFSENTVVETSARIEGGVGSKLLVAKATPVAPLAAQARTPYHLSLRVAVRKTLGGRFEARSLGPRDDLQAGEQEALLVPISSETKF